MRSTKKIIVAMLLFVSSIAFAQTKIFRHINSNDGQAFDSNSQRLNAMRCAVMAYPGEYTCAGDTCLRNTISYFTLKVARCSEPSDTKKVKCFWLENSEPVGVLYYTYGSLHAELSLPETGKRYFCNIDKHTLKTYN